MKAKRKYTKRSPYWTAHVADLAQHARTERAQESELVALALDIGLTRAEDLLVRARAAAKAPDA